MRSRFKQQQGVALIVSLVILVLVTVAGVATMESTGMQLKMANASRDRQQAFEAAETALRMIEEDINDNVGDLAELDDYNEDCDGGRCFQGDARDSGLGCSVVNNAAPAATQPWQTGSGGDFLNVWDDDALHLSTAVDGYANDVSYIVEFRCSLPAFKEDPDPSSELAQIFRITARGMSDSGRVEAMLQSTYKRTE